jgi:hypothetical protein
MCPSERRLCRVLLLAGEIPVKVGPDGSFALLEPKKRAGKPSKAKPIPRQPWQIAA